VEELAVGGTVIGPMPEVSFKRGFAHLDCGGTLVMCTDGLVERANAAGEMLGVEPIRDLVHAHPQATAAELLDRLFDAARAFGGGRAWEDDATAVVVKRAARAG
jgi:serine phosphatase RsbU (regulator of sigma subunit)